MGLTGNKAQQIPYLADGTRFFSYRNSKKPNETGNDNVFKK
jgi:hypothetical protein